MLIDCRACSATVDVTVLAEYESYDHEMQIPERFGFGKCPRCAAPLLWYQDDYGGGWDKPVRMFPPRDQLFSFSIPRSICRAFNEAISCYHAKAFTATALMCRKTLEGVCHEHGITKRNLATGLAELKKQGYIEGRLFEWADELRLFGNEAAHDVEVEISAQDASDIVEFTRALLEYVYTFREKFEKFRQRRSAQTPPQLPPPATQLTVQVPM